MNHDAAPLVFILLIGALPLAMFLHDWWTLRGIPDPQPGDIWRSQNSGEAVRIDKVGLTHCGMLTWDYTIETAPGEFNCIPMTGFSRRDWRLMVRDEKRVLENTKGPQC